MNTDLLREGTISECEIQKKESMGSIRSTELDNMNHIQSIYRLEPESSLL